MLAHTVHEGLEFLGLVATCSGLLLTLSVDLARLAILLVAHRRPGNEAPAIDRPELILGSLLWHILRRYGVRYLAVGGVVLTLAAFVDIVG